MNNFIQDGKSVAFTNSTGADISSGDPVPIGNCIGVAATDIEDGETGTVTMVGVYALPKVPTAVIAQGEMVIWDSSAEAFDDSQATPATGDISNCCVAWEGAGNGTTEVVVKINVGVGTVA